MNLTLSETPKTGFLATRPIYFTLPNMTEQGYPAILALCLTFLYRMYSSYLLITFY